MWQQLEEEPHNSNGTNTRSQGEDKIKERKATLKQQMKSEKKNAAMNSNSKSQYKIQWTKKKKIIIIIHVTTLRKKTLNIWIFKCTKILIILILGKCNKIL